MLQALNDRIARLRARLASGDPDMESEIQAAIERAEAKRNEWLASQPAAKHSAQILVVMPKAAQTYREQIRQGLDGNPREAQKARHTLRKMILTVADWFQSAPRCGLSTTCDPVSVSDQMVAGARVRPCRRRYELTRDHPLLLAA